MIQAERIEIEVSEGERWVFRTIQPRDYTLIMGRLGILPSVKRGMKRDEYASAIEAAALTHTRDIQDRFICECSISPEITMKPALMQPAGTIALPEIPQDVYDKIVAELWPKSGLGEDAALALDPSVATDASS